MKQIILTLTLLFPAMAYGKSFIRPYLPAYFNTGTKQIVVRSRDGRTSRVFPMSDNVSEAIQKRAAEVAVGMETCKGACFIHVTDLVAEAEETPGGNLDTVLEAVKYANLKGKDSDLVKEIIFYVSNIGETKAAVLIYAGTLSRHWTGPDGALDTAARGYIVELAHAWAYEAENGGNEFAFATAAVFNESIDDAENRQDEMEDKCLPNAA